MPVAYSQGFHPQPRIAIAAPLAVGITSEGELMDVFLNRRVSPDFFHQAVSEQLPQGLEVLRIKDIWPRLPSTQSQLLFAQYRVEISHDADIAGLVDAIRSLLQKESLPWQHARGEKVHRYDLRRLIDDVWIEQGNGTGCILGMRLYNNSQGAGRPEQVLLALGISESQSIHRTQLITGSRECG